MKANDENIEIRSPETQDILGHVPSWAMQHGTGVIFIFFSLLLFLCSILEYSDSISGRLHLTTTNPPIKLMAKSSGRLNLFVKDRDSVVSGEILGVIDNPANTSEMLHFIKYLDTMNISNTEVIVKLPDIGFFNKMNAGDLHQAYSIFLKAHEDYSYFIKTNYGEKQTTSLNSQLIKYQKLDKELKRQKFLASIQHDLAFKNYMRDSMLYKEKIVSEAEFYKVKEQYLHTRSAYESYDLNIENNLLKESELKTKILQTEIDNKLEEKRLHLDLEESFNLVRSKVIEWKQKFLFNSPCNGYVFLSKFWANEQFAQEGEEVMSIVPKEKEKIIGIVYAPIYNSAKIEIGQTVRVKFENYKSSEYGYVLGRILTISSIPKDGYYLLRVSFPKGLLTSYNKKLAFRQDMQGTAEIITNKVSILSRLTNKFKDLITTM